MLCLVFKRRTLPNKYELTCIGLGCVCYMYMSRINQVLIIYTIYLKRLPPKQLLKYCKFGKDCVTLIFTFFLRLASHAKLKFALISDATLSVKLALRASKVKKRKNRFSENSQNLLYTNFVNLQYFTVSTFQMVFLAQAQSTS